MHQQPRKRSGRVLVAATILAALIMALAAPAQATGGIVAGFGDSVAAGFRVGAISSSPYAANCARTDAGYPTLVGASLGLTTRNLACSGATAAAGLNGPQATPLGTVPAQIQQAKSLPHIKLATLTDLANDVNWSGWLALCASPTNCATDANTTTFRKQLAQGNVGVVKALYQMVNTLKVDHVSLPGYYDPLGPAAAAFGFTPAEIAWYQARLADVNTVLKADTKLFPNRVSFVSLASLSAAAGDVQLDPTSDGIFHPTFQGQNKIKSLVLADYALAA